MIAASECPLSVVIATKSPWPEIRATLDSVHAQATAAGGEVLIADSTGRALPADVDRRYPGVNWIVELDASSFRLRALATARARGRVIAITEDHCVVRPTWCERILEAHAQHPEAAAIGGGVENGSSNRLLDWASFLIANGPFVPPLENGPTDRISLQANISYKRRAVPLPDAANAELMEMLHNQRLRERGEVLLADDRIVVDHFQSVSFPTFCALHFHNGRLIAGYRLARMSWPERILRLAGCAVLPAVMLWRTLCIAYANRRLRSIAARTSPLMAWLLCCHSAGEFVGYLFGTGRSAQFRHIG